MVHENLLFQGESIGKLWLCVNNDRSDDVGSNLCKS